MKQCNIVADGCGARGLYAFAGAIEEIQKTYEINNFAGVSAGAVVGALVKTGKDLKVVWDLDKFTPPAFLEWCDKNLHYWIDDLQIYISDLLTGNSVICNCENCLSVLYETVFKSMAIPGMFIFDGHHCDGTICSNFPYIGGLNKLTGLNKDTDIPTFGLFMYMDERPKCYLKNTDNPTIKDLFLAHFNYVDAQRIHKEHLPNTVRKIIYIPVMDIMATDFDLTDDQKESLYNNGREAAKEFFKLLTED